MQISSAVKRLWDKRGDTWHSCKTQFSLTPQCRCCSGAEMILHVGLYTLRKAKYEEGMNRNCLENGTKVKHTDTVISPTDYSGKKSEGYWLIPFLTERWSVLFTKPWRWILQWWRYWIKGKQPTSPMFSGESKAGGVLEPQMSNWVIFFKPGREICQVEDAQELYTKQLNHHQDSLCLSSGKHKVADNLVISRVTAGQQCWRSQLWIYVFKAILK